MRRIWFGWGSLWSVSYINQSQPKKNYLLWGKSGPNANFNHFFLGLGLALGWGVRRFHNNIYMFSDPTEFGKSQTPYRHRWRGVLWGNNGGGSPSEEVQPISLQTHLPSTFFCLVQFSFVIRIFATHLTDDLYDLFPLQFMI